MQDDAGGEGVLGEGFWQSKARVTSPGLKKKHCLFTQPRPTPTKTCGDRPPSHANGEAAASGFWVGLG